LGLAARARSARVDLDLHQPPGSSAAEPGADIVGSRQARV
jgi:hypothetical protein